MEPISRIVAENLRRLREERKLSLDAVAKSSGVSKSMLGQIERGVTSPTVSTLWKIAYGLKISFMALLAKPEMDMEIVERDEAGPFLEDEGRYRLYVMFPFDTARKFEMFAVELDAGARFDAAPHQEGTQEFITVFEGTLTLGLNGEKQTSPQATPSISAPTGPTSMPTNRHAMPREHGHVLFLKGEGRYEKRLHLFSILLAVATLLAAGGCFRSPRPDFYMLASPAENAAQSGEEAVRGPRVCHRPGRHTRLSGQAANLFARRQRRQRQAVPVQPLERARQTGHRPCALRPPSPPPSCRVRVWPYPLRSSQQPQWRIAVDVTRFDGAPNGNVVLDAGWLLLNEHGDVVRSGRFVRRAPPGHTSLRWCRPKAPFSPSSGGPRRDHSLRER